MLWLAETEAWCGLLVKLQFPAGLLLGLLPTRPDSTFTVGGAIGTAEFGRDARHKIVDDGPQRQGVLSSILRTMPFRRALTFDNNEARPRKLF